MRNTRVLKLLASEIKLDSSDFKENLEDWFDKNMCDRLSVRVFHSIQENWVIITLFLLL